MDSCLFCRIVAGEIPSRMVFESSTMRAFLDAFPTSAGHVLVVPKQHVATMLEADETLLADWIQTTKKVALAVKAASGADGINLIQNNGEAAGQVIPHLHMHIVPRYAGDGLKHWPGKPLDEKEGEAMMAKIRVEMGEM